MFSGLCGFYNTCSLYHVKHLPPFQSLYPYLLKIVDAHLKLGYCKKHPLKKQTKLTNLCRILDNLFKSCIFADFWYLKWNLFAKVIIFVNYSCKSCISDVWLDSKYVFEGLCTWCSMRETSLCSCCRVFNNNCLAEVSLINYQQVAPW